MAARVAVTATVFLLGLVAAVVFLRLLGVLGPGFTAEDWFQLAYPALWSVVGMPVGYLLSARTASPTATVSFVRIIVIPVHTRPRPSAAAATTQASSSDDSEPWLFIAGALIVAVLLAWAYVEFREVALGVAGALISFTLGLTVGVVYRRVDLGWFAGDWMMAVAGSLVLAGVAVVCGYVLLHPVKAPPVYSVLFDAYPRKG